MRSSNTLPTFHQHILELRRRIFFCALFFIAGSALGYVFYTPLQEFLVKPFGQPIYYTSVLGGFNLMFSVSLFTGALLTLPVAVYHLIQFLAPISGKATSKRFFLTVGFLALVLAIAGSAFAYYVSLPSALHFLGKFEGHGIEALVSSDSYLHFITRYIAGFALLFQLPLVMLSLNKIHPMDPGGLMKMQKWVILVSFVASAILTPTPDPINQTIMAIPIIVLYELSIGLVWLINRRTSIQRYHNPTPDYYVQLAPGSVDQHSAPLASPNTTPPTLDLSSVQVASYSQSLNSQHILDLR